MTFQTLYGEWRRHWYVYASVAVIWTLALFRLLGDPTLRSPLLFNWTSSLPYRVAWLLPSRGPLQRSDLIVYRFDSADQRLHGQPFFKRVVGVPGDSISVDQRQVAINGVPVGRAKPMTQFQQPLTPIEPGTIPPDHYYVQGSHPDAFDSRYQESGLVRAEQVIGRAWPIW